MATSLISGFITRKQAAERCKRSERSLQRYWSDAIEHQTADVLERLKLRMEDGEIIAGPDVTKDRIEELKKNGRNPTWFVHATWAEKKYGPRLDDIPVASSQPPVEQEPEHQTDRDSVNVQVIKLLRQQLVKNDDEIGYLRAELKIKNEQITEANTRTRESNLLMQQLQTLLGEVQQRAFPALTESAVRRDASRPMQADVIADQDRQESEEGTEPRKKTTKPTPRPAPRKKKQSSAVEQPLATDTTPVPSAGAEQVRKHKWHEMPTLRKLFSRR